MKDILNIKISVSNVINNIFKNLNKNHIDLIVNYTTNIINIIFIIFNIKDEKQFITQLKLNNNRDLFSIAKLLLPFIDDKNKFELYGSITSLNDLYIKKIDTNEEFVNRYIYSNIQYNRCFREYKNNKLFIKEQEFKEEHFINNYYLLCETLQIISNKLSVNWIMIRPIILNNYKNIQLYKNTTLNNLKIWDPTTDELPDRQLYVGDIYNSIVSDLFHNIKYYKWLLYSNKDKINLMILDEYINVNNILNRKKWLNLTIKEKNEFEIGFNKLKNEQSELITSMYIFYSIYFKSKDTLEDLLEEDEIKEENIEEIIDYKTTINKLEEEPIEEMYKYLYYSIDKLNCSWYKKYLFEDEKVSKICKYKGKIILKDIYNYGKSLQLNKSVPLNKYFQSLSSENKKMIIKRLKGDNSDLWFNISNNIKRRDSGIVDIKGENQEIYNSIREHIIDIVFENLIIKGNLSEIVHDFELTDEERLPTNTKLKAREIQNKLKKSILNKSSEYNEAYYYLTHNKFKNLNKIRLNINGEYKDVDYFEALTSPAMEWYGFYAMDMISQINYFHRFINNRVIFVTGGTGVGKSTQVPKLALYALKMINYQNRGVVCHTQPRTGPTINVASWISTELGVQLSKHSVIHNKNIKTDDFYVQYKSQTDKHVEQLQDYNLQIVTDGSLLVELRKNILMKKKYKKKNKNVYKINNEYEVILIDESHEHNANMDLLLTLIKTTLYYNNSLKLLIVSATMDMDEPIYRRFFRDINDNLIYPNNSFLIENKLDRINVDRRLHIAAPGKGNLYTIEEKYIPAKNDTYLENENLAKKIIIELCNSDLKGDILLFSVGTSQILNLIKFFNTNTPKHIIALPYYSQLYNSYKTLIEGIHNKKKMLTIDKRDIINELEGRDLKYPKVAEGTYKNVIIIATPVAEASVTFPSLYYVVETGFLNVVSYDVYRKFSYAELKPISENSRLQRRGRVGRVANGMCIYCYKKDARLKVKDYYSICTNDIESVIYDTLYSSNKDTLMLGSMIDPNNIENVEEYLDNLKVNKQGIDQIIIRQYFENNIKKLYIGNDKHSQYLPLNVNYYQTGFNVESLIDNAGIFYMIHPEELKIKRNILTGEIIEYNNEKLKEPFKSNMMLEYMSNLCLSLKIYNLNYNYYNEIDIKYEIEKSNIAEVINNINRKIPQLSYEELYGYYYSKLYGCSEEYIILISMISDLEKKMIPLHKYCVNIDKMIKIFKEKNIETDYMILLNIFNTFKRIFKNLKIFKTTQISNTIDNSILKKYSDIQEKINTGELKLVDIPSDIDLNIYYKLKSGNQMETTIYDLMYSQSGIANDLFNNRIAIFDWCEKNYLSYVALDKALKKYNVIRNILSSYDNLFDELTGKLVISDKSNNLEHNIIRTLLRLNYKYVGINKKYLQNIYDEKELKIGVINRQETTGIKQINKFFTFRYLSNRNDITYITNIKLKTIIKNMPYIFRFSKLTNNSKNIILSEFDPTLVSYLTTSNDKQFNEYIKKYIEYISNNNKMLQYGGTKIFNCLNN